MSDRLQNFIDGTFVDSTSSASIDIVDPATEAVVAVSPVSTEEEVAAAIAAAERAFLTWGRTTPSARQAALLKLADAIEEHADEIVAAQVRNTGQIAAMVKAEEVLVCADQVRFFAGAARMLEGRSAGEYMEGFTSYVRREPIGVVGQVTPWNYPFMMAIWKIAPALAAGNTLVFKPSEHTPMSTLKLGELLAEIFEGSYEVERGTDWLADPGVEIPEQAAAVHGITTEMARAEGTRRVDLDVTGMTCASCANRIERKLNKMDGVTASVNYATEKAHIDAERRARGIGIVPESQLRDDRDPGSSEEVEHEVLHLGDRGTVDPRSEDDGIRRGEPACAHELEEEVVEPVELLVDVLEHRERRLHGEDVGRVTRDRHDRRRRQLQPGRGVPGGAAAPAGRPAGRPRPDASDHAADVRRVDQRGADCPGGPCGCGHPHRAFGGAGRARAHGR